MTLSNKRPQRSHNQPNNHTTNPNTGKDENAGDFASAATSFGRAGNYLEVDGELVELQRPWMSAFLACLATSRANVDVACRAVGINRSTYHRWRVRDSVFAMGCAEAEEALADTLESTLYVRAIDDGDVDAIKFALGGIRRDRWGRKATLELDGSAQIAHTVEVLQGQEPRQVDAARRHAAAALLVGGTTDGPDVVPPNAEVVTMW